MCPMQSERTTNQTLEAIAKRCLRVDTLKTRNSDALDFRDCAVWQLKEALEAAFAAGVAAATTGAGSKARSKQKGNVQ